MTDARFAQEAAVVDAEGNHGAAAALLLSLMWFDRDDQPPERWSRGYEWHLWEEVQPEDGGEQGNVLCGLARNADGWWYRLPPEGELVFVEMAEWLRLWKRWNDR